MDTSTAMYAAVTSGSGSVSHDSAESVTLRRRLDAPLSVVALVKKSSSSSSMVTPSSASAASAAAISSSASWPLDTLKDEHSALDAQMRNARLPTTWLATPSRMTSARCGEAYEIVISAHTRLYLVTETTDAVWRTVTLAELS